ncbi:MAG: DUF1326 domain-containing protein [Geminicoccaceae bacterium]
MVDWEVEGVEFGNCSCNYSCPCQFEDRPSRGYCHGFGVARIDRGRFGDVRLDGLCGAAIYAWPGAVFEGRGQMQLIIDERADARQRHALETILKGGETDEARTHWWVFHAMSETIHPTLFRPIAFACDVEARTASVRIDGILESTGRPIRSPVNGEPHRVRIDLPHGIEFEIAEIGSASTRARAALSLDLDDTYGQFNPIHFTGRGLVRHR